MPTRLFEEIHARFGTRFDEMDWHAYFPADMDAVGERCAVRLGFPPIPCKPLPLKHLLDVVMAGVWFRPAAYARSAIIWFEKSTTAICTSGLLRVAHDHVIAGRSRRPAAQES